MTRDMEAIRKAHRERMSAFKKEHDENQAKKEQKKLKLKSGISKSPSLEKLNEECKKKAINLIKSHENTLRVKYSQLAATDDYGVADVSKWIKSRNYFINNVLYPVLGGKNQCRLEFGELEQLVDQFASMPISHPRAIEDVGEMSGIEYELFCAKILKRAGWNTTLTVTSGDQGVDIVADKGALRLAFQCKRYSSSVGNAAVQEICAGTKFVHANYGAVVSNAPFTPQAKQLAKSTGILLIHHSDLDRIDDLVKLIC